MNTHVRRLIAEAILVSNLLVCFAANQVVGADQGTERQTAQVKADNIAYNPEGRRITASGHVVITVKDVTLKMDEAVVSLEGGSKHDPIAKKAAGHITIQADSVVYDATVKKITASGHVAITLIDGSTLNPDKAVIMPDDDYDYWWF